MIEPGANENHKECFPLFPSVVKICVLKKRWTTSSRHRQIALFEDQSIVKVQEDVQRSLNRAAHREIEVRNLMNAVSGSKNDYVSTLVSGRALPKQTCALFASEAQSSAS